MDQPNLPVWLHLSPQTDHELVTDLCDAVLAADPGVNFLFSSTSAPSLDLEDFGQFIDMPQRESRQISEFLDRHKPRCLGWLDPALAFWLFSELSARNLPIHIVDNGHLIDTQRRWRFVPRLGRSRFRHVSTVTIGDRVTERALLRLGARADQIKLNGLLERGSKALDCDLAERDAYADLLAARPIWLAAQINFDELDAILAAHTQALRRAHRMLLILVPSDVDDGDQFAEVLRHNTLQFRQRSRGEDPDEDCQVYLADTEDEMGLWYRLAPITFIGTTLEGRPSTGPNPFDAAALGSVVVHGPNIAAHEPSFTRLRRAGAARRVAHPGELAYVLESLLAPDRAAELAHAAWSVTTADAVVIEHLALLLAGVSVNEGDVAK